MILHFYHRNAEDIIYYRRTSSTLGVSFKSTASPSSTNSHKSDQITAHIYHRMQGQASCSHYSLVGMIIVIVIRKKAQ